MKFLSENRNEFTSKIYKKNEILISAGQVCNQLFYIEKGLVKLTSYKNEKEFILNFFKESQFCTVIDSLLSKEKSDCELIALEDTEVLIINIDKLEKICSKNHQAETFLRTLTANSSVALIARVKELLLKSPENRYANFLKNHSDILQRISLGDIAKYVGISQVSLSRIRAKK